MSWNPNQGQDPNQPSQYGGYSPPPQPQLTPTVVNSRAMDSSMADNSQAGSNMADSSPVDSSMAATSREAISKAAINKVVTSRGRMECLLAPRAPLALPQWECRPTLKLA